MTQKNPACPRLDPEIPRKLLEIKLILYTVEPLTVAYLPHRNRLRDATFAAPAGAIAPALVDAVKMGNIEIAQVLLAAGGDPDAPDGNGGCPLDYAAFDNRPDLARLLLQYNAHINVEMGGSTPLDLAVARGNLEAAKLLIDNGGDVRRVYPSGRTPLHIAANNGNTAMVGLLIDRGADADALDLVGLSPLDLAIAKNQAAIAALLIEAGATPRARTLHNALRLNHVEMVRLLLSHTTEPIAPLFKEALNQHHPEIVEVLLQAGANINARDEAGFTPLHDAALAGNAGAVRLLLEHGADINAADKDSGATALYMAATMGREEVVTLLLEKGADPHIGPSPLKAATAGGFDKIADLIKAK